MAATSLKIGKEALRSVKSGSNFSKDGLPSLPEGLDGKDLAKPPPRLGGSAMVTQSAILIINRGKARCMRHGGTEHWQWMGRPMECIPHDHTDGNRLTRQENDGQLAKASTALLSPRRSTCMTGWPEHYLLPCGSGAPCAWLSRDGPVLSGAEVIRLPRWPNSTRQPTGLPCHALRPTPLPNRLGGGPPLSLSLPSVRTVDLLRSHSRNTCLTQSPQSTNLPIAVGNALTHH